MRLAYASSSPSFLTTNTILSMLLWLPSNNHSLTVDRTTSAASTLGYLNCPVDIQGNAIERRLCCIHRLREFK